MRVGRSSAGGGREATSRQTRLHPSLLACSLVCSRRLLGVCPVVARDQPTDVCRLSSVFLSVCRSVRTSPTHRVRAASSSGRGAAARPGAGVVGVEGWMDGRRIEGLEERATEWASRRDGQGRLNQARRGGEATHSTHPHTKKKKIETETEKAKRMNECVLCACTHAHVWAREETTHHTHQTTTKKKRRADADAAWPGLVSRSRFHRGVDAADGFSSKGKLELSPGWVYCSNRPPLDSVALPAPRHTGCCSLGAGC